MKIMASGLITSWKIDGDTMETVRDFIFLGSTITTETLLLLLFIKISVVTATMKLKDVFS